MVRPERSAAPASLTDTLTGLKWQQILSTSKYTWAAAKTYCDGLSLGGTGWRLPTLIELESILDYGKFGPAIDETVFPNTPPNLDWFWSSSPVAGYSPISFAWAVPFDNVPADGRLISSSGLVRCVR